MHRIKQSSENTNNNKNYSTKRNNIRPLLILMLSIIILALFIMSPIFEISKVKVNGNSHYTDLEIINASQVITGVNGFKNIGGNYKQYISLRYAEAEKNILKKSPYIKQASVRYIIPDKIVIEVEERTPMVIMPYLGTYLLVDRDGFAIESVSDENRYKLPKVTGLIFSGYEIGQPLKMDNIGNFNELTFLIDALTEDDKNDTFKIIEVIESIDVNNSNNIYFFIDSRIVVNIGSVDDLSYKIRALKQIYTKNIGQEEKGFLDFVSGDYPVFIPE